jgi:DNA-binding CsgD family transcriptional regulator
MSDVNERDLLNLLDGTRRVHEAATDLDRLPVVMLDVVRRLVPVEHLTYNEVNLAADRLLSFSDSRDTDSTLLRHLPAWERHMDEHPLIRDVRRQVARGREPGAARKVSDFLSRDRYQNLGLYHECFRHLDTEYQMVLTLVAADGHTVGIALNRKLKDFSERDRRVLQLCRPHLRIAYLNALRRLRLRRLFDPAAKAQAVEDLRRLGLTHREAEVMFHVLQGETSPEIARSLSNSPRTVHKHLEHVFAKLGVTSRAAAAAKVFESMERQEP